MVVVFRTDAAPVIGHGHLMRCLTLADVLRGLGVTCHFICREHQGLPRHRVQERGHALHLLAPLSPDALQAMRRNDPATWTGVSQTADAAETVARLGHIDDVTGVVVDHYGLDRTWDALVRPASGRLLVVEESASRPRDCDLLLDTTLGREPTAYDTLVPAGARCLVGATYALIHPRFLAVREEALARRAVCPKPEQLLVMMGGTDPTGLSARMLRGIQEWLREANMRVTVVLGADQPGREEVQALLEDLPNGQWIDHTPDMAQLMLQADLAIGGAGSASWERCCLGLPSVMVTLADNQREISRAMSERDAALVVDVPDDERVARTREALRRLSEDMALYRRLSTNASALADGEGSYRVAKHLMASGADAGTP